MSQCVAAARLAFAAVAVGVVTLMCARWWIPSASETLTVPGVAVISCVCFASTTAILTWLMPRAATQFVPARIRDAFDTFQDGILVLDESERIVVANRAFVDQVQLSRSTLLGHRPSSLRWNCGRGVSKKHFPWIRVLDSPRSAEPGDQTNQESETLLNFRRRDQQQRYFSVTAARIQDDSQQRDGVLVTFRDVTQVENKRADMERMLAVLRANREEISQKNVELQSLADSDVLTGCLNRRSFLNEFDRYALECQSHGQPIACVMIDNDHFKAVNDTHGHGVGDGVLRSVATTLQSVFGSSGSVCRYGGEEFCVVLPNAELEQAAELAESARQAIAETEWDDAPGLSVTASFGVAGLSYSGKSDDRTSLSPRHLIDDADKCLYVAKSRGRNQVVVFDAEIDATTIESLQHDDHAVVQDHVRTADDDLDQVPIHAVMGLVSALAYRDTTTAEHSRRVANLCVHAASSLLGQRETHILEMAALLHDIGKIALPDEILQKPGPLTPDQWRLIAKHHQIGLEIIAGTFHHEELCEIVRTHMAFYGGRSLIAGLPTGRQIPLAARILTIADTYDVITSDRPHRAGKGHDEAVAELRRCAGTQFDPVLVEHFVHSLNGDRRNDRMTETISRRTALEIGLQIEQLARAIDNQDISELQFLATRLHNVAERNKIEPIANAAHQLQCDAAGENVRWIDVLDRTHRLLNLCRATQDAYLVDHSKQTDG